MGSTFEAAKHGHLGSEPPGVDPAHQFFACLLEATRVVEDQKALHAHAVVHQQTGNAPGTARGLRRVVLTHGSTADDAAVGLHAKQCAAENIAAGVTLAGTLTLPKGEGPFPAAILITGSGGQNRNEEIFQHKPFWVIADHLTRGGIAVLRVDDRGVGGSTAGDNPGQATSFDFAGDVGAGMDFLRAHARIAPDKIGLIGHSEGGIIAPLVARERDDVAFAVLLAGTGVRGDKLLLMQHAAIMRASDIDEETISAACAAQERLFATVLDSALSPQELETRLTRAIQEEEEFQKASAEDQAQGLKTALAQLTNPWMVTFIRHDPAAVLRKVRCPVLALNGELDLQVPFKANLDAIARALKAAQNPDFSTRAFPGLNHLYQHCETGLITEYGKIEETFSVEVLEVMRAWIGERVIAR